MVWPHKPSIMELGPQLWPSPFHLDQKHHNVVVKSPARGGGIQIHTQTERGREGGRERERARERERERVGGRERVVER